jgi:carboxylate-amine ligase
VVELDGPTEADIRAAFDDLVPFTVGLEEEVLLVDPVTHLPVARAADVVARHPHLALQTELPASQVELATAPGKDEDAAIAELTACRAGLIDACDGVRPVAAAVHPYDLGDMDVSDEPRRQELLAEFGMVARRQLVGALQVHVAVGSAEVALPVYNAMRSYLPELTALAAAAPFHAGVDSGFATVRPIISGQLPRQGVPPIIPSWRAFADDLAWGRRGGTVSSHANWWWELRPHIHHGTLEVRVPDAQPTVEAAGAVAAVVRALVVHLALRHRDGFPLPLDPTWRIAENRWRAARHGMAATFADLRTGDPQPAERRLHDLLDTIAPCAGPRLDDARRLVDAPTSARMRALGVAHVVPWLADAFAA